MPKGQKNHAIGNRRKQAILDLIAQRPMTRAGLAETLDAASSSIAKHLMDLHDAVPRQAFICGHVPNHRGSPAVLWAKGNKPDVEYVPNCRPAPKTSAAERQAQILALLKHTPRSAQQLVGKIHVVKKTISVHIAQLRKPGNRQVYICRWVHPAKAYPGTRAASWVPVYAVGNKPDATKPTRETKAAIYARQKQDPEYREEAKRRAKAYYRIKKFRKKPQGIFAALGL